MKSTIFFALILAMLAGCANNAVVMKTDKKYFKPMKTYAQLNKTTPKKTKFTLSMLKKELDVKTTTIELLTKENRELRERVSKLEKRLSIIQS